MRVITRVTHTKVSKSETETAPSLDDEVKRVVELMLGPHDTTAAAAIAAYAARAMHEGRKIVLFDRVYARQFFGCLAECRLRSLAPAWTSEGSLTYPPIFDDCAVAEYPHDVVVRAAFRYAAVRADLIDAAVRASESSPSQDDGQRN